MHAVLERAPLQRRNAPSDPHPAETGTWGTERREFNRRGLEVLEQLAALPSRHPDRGRLRAQAIEMHLPLAKRLARRYDFGSGILDDLYQVAALALIKAVDGFDPSRNDVFAAYAVPTILGELRRYFRDRCWDLRAPRHLQDRYLRVRDAADTLTQRLAQTPTVADIAGYLAMPEEHVIEALVCADDRRAASLDAASPHAPGVQLGERLQTVDRDLERAEARLTVEPLLSQLPERERRIVALRFYGDRTQSQIAADLGISQMHVSRLLTRALNRMRATLSTGGVLANDG